MRQYHGHPRGSIMNNIMDVHKLSINLDVNRYIEYTLMYIVRFGPTSDRPHGFKMRQTG